MIGLFIASIAGMFISYLVMSAITKSWKPDWHFYAIAAAVFLFGSWLFASFDSKITRGVFVVVAALSHHIVNFLIRKRQ